MKNYINVRTSGKLNPVEIVHKFKAGFRATHNGDGKYLLVWAVGVDGQVYRTTGRSMGYRPAQPGATYPDTIQTIAALQAEKYNSSEKEN
jgi:hypothetical protein